MKLETAELKHIERIVAISKAARQTLLDGGLLYTGLNGRGGGTVFPYPGRRFP